MNMKNLTSMYRVYRYTEYPQYWPSEATVYVDSAPGTVEEYVTDNNGTPTLVGNYIGTVTYPTFASFPTVGRTNRLYIDGSTNILYRWTGSAYVSVGGTIPTLDDVLASGDSSLENAFVNSIGVWDSAAEEYATIVGVDDGIEVYSATGAFLFRVQSGYLVFGTSTIEASFDPSSLTHSRNYILPDANGTVALTSDITITGVTVSAPLDSSGGSTPNITTKMLPNRLIGRSSAGTGVMEEIAIGSGLSLSAGTLSATGGGGGGLLHGTTSGTDTYTVTIAGAPAYADGDAYLIRFAIGNTTNATLNINSQGARPLYRNNDGPLLGGDVLAGGEMICVYNSTTNVFQCIGVSPNSLIAYVTNADSVTITKGMPVYAFGGTGDRMTVKKAYNTTDATSAQTVGLVLSTSIAANQKGLIMMQGLLDGLSILPTSTFADGDPIYLGATAGTITNVKPHAPNHLVYLGVVTTASPGSAGRMYVRVQNGYELDELHNVQAHSPTLKDTLWYDNTVSPAQWKTASIATILGYTPIQLSSLSGTAPVSYNSGTGAISMVAASTSNDGYLKSTDWTTFNNKQANITGAASTIASANLTVSRALISSIAGKVSVSATTDTELGYVSGVTSSIQTQLGNKQNALTLTTAGTSGPATLVGATLNIPQYSGGGGGSQKLETIIAWDGNGSLISVGAGHARYAVLSNGGTISGWSIVAIGTSPTCTIDVLYVDPGGTALPSVSICASALPALATGNSIYSTTLTGWTTTTIAAGGTLGFRIMASSNVLQLKITLIYS